MVDIGQRNDRLEIRRKTRDQRPDGGYETADETLATVWAAVKPVSARESEQAGRLAGSVTYMVTLEADDLPYGAQSDWSIRWLTALPRRAARIDTAAADLIASYDAGLAISFTDATGPSAIMKTDDGNYVLLNIREIRTPPHNRMLVEIVADSGMVE